MKEREMVRMKVYIVYLLTDYATAVFMSIDKKLCEKEANKLGRNAWVEEYDFSAQKSFELEC
jgi:hypothetical protein